MGYRSDMKIAVYLADKRSLPEGITALPFAALKLWFDETYPVAVARREWEAETEYGDHYILVSYENVKWYDDYEHVKAVKAALATFDEAFGTGYQNARAHWEFIRVGEEIEDIKVDGSPYSESRLRVSRQIIFD